MQWCASSPLSRALALRSCPRPGVWRQIWHDVLNIFNLFGQQKIKQNLPTLGSTRCPGETAIPHSGPAWLDPQLPGARGYRAAVAGWGWSLHEALEDLVFSEGQGRESYLPNINLKVQSWFLWIFFIGRDWGIMRVPWKQSHLSCLLSFLNKGCLDFFSFWQCGVLRQRFPHARELRPGCCGRDSWDTNWRRVINSYNLHMWFD